MYMLDPEAAVNKTCNEESFFFMLQSYKTKVVHAMIFLNTKDIGAAGEKKER